MIQPPKIFPDRLVCAGWGMSRIVSDAKFGSSMDSVEWVDACFMNASYLSFSYGLVFEKWKSCW
jgi:hypothetical protein